MGHQMKGNLEELLQGAFLALPLPDEDFELDELENNRLKEFNHTVDFEYVQDAYQHAPSYKRLKGRSDPFNFEQLKGFVGDWSKLIDRPVITFYDAVDHALALCQMWVEEDEVLAAMAEGRADEVVGPVAPPPEPEIVERPQLKSTKEEIEEARQAWKEAIRQRDETLKYWKEHTRVLHQRYIALRDK